jgi:putative N6-adenine-specific DNA methylase
MYLYQKDHRFIAQIASGLEAEGGGELVDLGAQAVEVLPRGVTFKADPVTLYRVVYLSRLLTRVLAPLVTFHCPDASKLYANARAVNWPKLFQPDLTFAVHAQVIGNPIRNTHFAALRFKDALVDRFRADKGRRPSVDIRNPDLGFHLRIDGDQATLSLDVSGGSLHRRGYRIRSVAAPLQETLAAAVVRKSGWDGERPLYDPMCGSGTLLTEACMHYCRIPAAHLRKHFGFERLPDFDSRGWHHLRRELDAGIRQLPSNLVAGSDISSEAIAAARVNLGRFPVLGAVRLRVVDFRKLDGLPHHLIITNPPYGIRLERGRDMNRFYQDLGDFLKRRCGGSTAYLFIGEPALAGSIGLKADWKMPIEAGGLSAKLFRYHMEASDTEGRREYGDSGRAGASETRSGGLIRRR